MSKLEWLLIGPPSDRSVKTEPVRPSSVPNVDWLRLDGHLEHECAIFHNWAADVSLADGHSLLNQAVADVSIFANVSR